MIDHNELLPEGREVGGFRIEKAIGHGNMGIIYRAIQINLNRPVALKILFKSVAEDQDFVRSFFREAQAAAAFTHQNIVQAFDVGQTEEGIYYFAMELIEGGDISLQLKLRGVYDPVEALEKMLGVADGLDYGSTLRKLTHGDIKPANIMITKAGTFKLADLGLARMGGEIAGESDGIMLTPLYAAPEMINGTWSVGDPRADMYSVGATLYQMMYGKPPFYDDDYHQVIQMQLTHQHQPLKSLIDKFPANISKLVDRFLEKDPDKRFENWSEAKHAMEVALKDPHGTHTKKKKKVIHFHQNEDGGDQSSDSESRSSYRPSSKKKKSSTPIIIALAALLAIAGLGYFAMNMKKDVAGQEYKELTARFKGKKPEAIIKLIENFVSRHGTTPPEAEKDLAKYRSMLDNRSLFDFGDLSHQEKMISEYEDQYKKKNPVLAENFRFNLSSIEKELNNNLKNNSLIFHLPYNSDLENHANFYSIKKISVNNGAVKYITAQVDKGVYFTGQSIVYGDISTLRFNSSSRFTVSLWLNPKQTDFPILGKCETSNGKISRGYLLSMSEGKLLVEFFEDSDSKKLAVKSKKELSQSSWNHIVVQYNGKSASLVINGMDAECDTISNSLEGDFSCTGPFVVGFRNMKAVVDDVRIWTRNLTDKELKELNGFRSITELETLTGRYHSIKKKIKNQKTPDKNPDNPDNPDVGPKNQDGIDHPAYENYVNSIKRLKKNIYKWETEAAEASNIAAKIAADIKEDKESFIIFNKSVRNANDEFYSLMQKAPQLQGMSITGGKLKGQTISKISGNLILTKETSDRLGSILNRYSLNDYRSIEAYNSIIITMIDNNLFKTELPGPYIFAMIIGDDELRERLVNSNRFPLLIKGLQRDLSQ